jgi:hypothetical protein
MLVIEWPSCYKSGELSKYFLVADFVPWFAECTACKFWSTLFSIAVGLMPRDLLFSLTASGVLSYNFLRSCGG